MPEQINIIGDGLAACCAAHLLLRRGFPVAVRRTSRPKPARLLVSDQTQHLLRDIFGSPDLFEGAARIRRRIVRWGGEPALELAHSGLVVAEQELLDRLWKMTPAEESTLPSSTLPEPAWTVVSSSDFESLPPLQSFGARQASTVSVALNANAADDCCWVESVPEGWLFLLPAGNGGATLICSGYTPETLLGQSRLVAAQIARLNDKVGAARSFPAFPGILNSLHGAGWLACGSAAMTFDPLCGEGAGHAAREALLASAVMGAQADGHAAKGLFAHYSTRLMQGFLRHLQVCLPFYRSGGSGHFWRSETASLQEGIAWTEDRLCARAPLRYRLAGFDLQPIAGAMV